MDIQETSIEQATPIGDDLDNLWFVFGFALTQHGPCEVYLWPDLTWRPNAWESPTDHAYYDDKEEALDTRTRWATKRLKEKRKQAKA